MITKRLNNLSKKHYKNPYKVPQSERSRRLGGWGVRKLGDLRISICNLSIVLLVILILSSCHHNRLKINEKELANEILLQEKEKSAKEKAGSVNRISETGSHQIKAIRLKENRSSDPANPPVFIDVPGTSNNIRKFKLSDVASSVRYVKLETPPDTTLLYDLFYYRPGFDSNIRSDGEQIIFEGLFGLTRFNMNGEYQETIWKNETGIRFFGTSMASFGGQDFFGVPFHIPISFENGDLYFSFHDGPGGNGLVMKYKPGKEKELTAKTGSEIPMQKIIPGDTVFVTDKNSIDRFGRIYGIGPDTWAGINDKWNAGTTGAMMISYNESGDTLCRFSDYDKIKNITWATVRNAVEIASYTFNNLLTIKPEYNDTVFRLIPPNRLLPAYIIDFGECSINYLEGFNPNFDLSNKHILNSLHESNEFLYIRYTRNHDGPNNRKKGAVKFYNLLFDKKQGKLYHQPGFTLLPEGIENDLDGGMAFWPEFITPQGEMMELVSGKIIKDFVNSSRFKKAAISEENRKKQISMAAGLRATDMVIMVVK